MLIIRIAATNKMARKTRKILKLLRLNQLHKGAAAKAVKPTLNVIKYVQPFVARGYPSRKTVECLILLSGYGKLNGERERWQNNQMIEEWLRECGIYGVDDLVRQIYTCRPNFEKSANFFWLCKLSAPRGGFIAKRHEFNGVGGVDWGGTDE